jgi:hypothetical protein
VCSRKKFASSFINVEMSFAQTDQLLSYRRY